MLGVLMQASAFSFGQLQFCDAPMHSSTLVRGVYGHNWGYGSSEPPGTLLACRKIKDNPQHYASRVQRAFALRFLTIDGSGKSVPATALLLLPKPKNVPNTRSGISPLIAIASGTVGVADKCAPSITMRERSINVTPRANHYLANGFSVLVMDYIGLGTALGQPHSEAGIDPADDHPYLEADSTAHVVLDSIRAARQVPGGRYSDDDNSSATIPDNWPVAITGYSQGGGASLWATLKAPLYAPDLPLKATLAGAAIVDLKKTILHLNGSLLQALYAYILIGAQNATGPSASQLNIDPYLTEAGRKAIVSARQQCAQEFVRDTILQLQFPNYHLHDLVEVEALMQDPHFLNWLASNSIIHNSVSDWTAPTSPVFAFHGLRDHVAPFSSQYILFKHTWSATSRTNQSANLVWRTLPFASHVSASQFDIESTRIRSRYPPSTWLQDRLLEGLP